MANPIKVLYDRYFAIVLMCLLIYMIYFTIIGNFFYYGIIISSVIYLNLASFKTGIFREGFIIFKYPFRIFKRCFTLDYKLIESVEIRSGNYVEGYLIIILYKDDFST